MSITGSAVTAEERVVQVEAQLGEVLRQWTEAQRFVEELNKAFEAERAALHAALTEAQNGILS